MLIETRGEGRVKMAVFATVASGCTPKLRSTAASHWARKGSGISGTGVQSYQSPQLLGGERRRHQPAAISCNTTHTVAISETVRLSTKPAISFPNAALATSAPCSKSVPKACRGFCGSPSDSRSKSLQKTTSVQQTLLDADLRASRSARKVSRRVHPTVIIP